MRPYIPKGWTGKLLLIEEAPGEDEDERSGRPFTGRAGRLLQRLYRQAGYSDLDVALVNSARCRPRNNATPTLRQVRACRAFVLRVIERTLPQTVLALGNVALRSLTNSGKSNVTRSRGRLLAVPGLRVPVTAYVTYHPAAVLHGATHLAERIADDLRLLRVEVEKWPEERVPNDKLLAIDTEYHDRDLLTVGIAGASSAAATDVSGLGVPSREIQAALESATAIAGHSVAGDVIQLVGAGYPVKEEWAQGRKCFDSLLLSRMGDENDLKYELETKLLSFKRVPPWKFRTTSISEINALLWPADARLERCRLDAWASRAIAQEYYKKLAKQQPLVEYTHRTAATLERLTLAGAFVDMDRFEVLSRQYHMDMMRSTDELTKLAAMHGVEGFSPSNDGHIRSLLYDKLGVPVTERTKKGKASVAKLTLKNLADQMTDKADILNLLVDYSKSEKLWRINAKSLGELLTPIGQLDGTPVSWLPFNINPLGARTGRRASNRPNSQNWPRSVRGIVRSRWPKGLIGDHDYQKLEVVLIAWIAGDELLFRDFTVGNGYFDVAKGVLGIDVEKDTPPYRAVKSIALGVHYNMKRRKMAQQLWDGVIDDDGSLVVVRFSADYETHEEEVDRLRRKYLNRYPALRAYMARQENTLLHDQAIASLTGRVRHLPLPDGRDTVGYGHMLNQAINFPVQSLASDVMASALMDIEEELLRLHNLSYTQYIQMLLETQKKILTNGSGNGIMYPLNMSLIFNEVHDDAVIDLHPDHLKRDQELVIECMRAVRSLRILAPSFDVKLGVDAKYGTHWGGK
jgi:uracil-DNA glycosylase family 4